MNTQTTCDTCTPTAAPQLGFLERDGQAMVEVYRNFRNRSDDHYNVQAMKRWNDHQLRDIGLSRNDLGVDLDDVRDSLDRTRAGFPR